MDCPRCLVNLLTLIVALFGSSSFCLSSGLATVGQRSGSPTDLISASWIALGSQFSPSFVATRSYGTQTGMRASRNPRTLDFDAIKQHLLASCYFCGPNQGDLISNGKSNESHCSGLRKIKSGPYLVFSVPHNAQGTNPQDIIAQDKITRQSCDVLFPCVSNLWMDYRKFAGANVQNPSQWQLTQSDIGNLDGLYVPAKFAPVVQSNPISSEVNTLTPELEKEIFDDPYWAYYSDVDRWGVVMRIDDKRLHRQLVVGPRYFDQEYSQFSKLRSTQAKSKRLATNFASSDRSAIIISTGYVKSSKSNLNNVSAIAACNAVASRLVEIKTQIQISTATVVEALRIRLNNSRVRPLIETMKFNIAHRLIVLNTTQSNRATGQLELGKISIQFGRAAKQRMATLLAQTSLLASQTLVKVQRIFKNVGSIEKWLLHLPESKAISSLKNDDAKGSTSPQLEIF